jgi:hypothetical protein
MLLLTAATLAAQGRSVQPSISVAFAIDGKIVPCRNLKIELRLDHQLVPVKRIDHGFIIPAIFAKLYDSPQSRDKNNIDIRLGCGEYSFDFSDQYPAQLLPGDWKFGIQYPTTWLIDSIESPLIEKGVWVSYLETECNGCDPGVIESIPHTDLRVAFVDRLRREQPKASGEERLNITYALAVFNVEYQQNRDYLLSLLNICLSNPSKSALDDICDDGRLYQYLANLYWRGDRGLLAPLLQAAGETEAGVLDEAGDFYADLLDRRPAEVLKGLDGLPVEKQKAVCELAGKDDLSFDSPKRERIVKQLQTIGSDLATRCSQQIVMTDNWWVKKK